MELRHTLFAAVMFMSVPVATANPLGQMKGKMKEGLYEMKMETDMGDMPGVPKGMAKQPPMVVQHCVTAEQIEKGTVGRPADQGGKSECEVKNWKMSGNTATYTTVCKGAQETTVDSTMTFNDTGYTMNNKVAMKQGGQVMNMTQKMESKYLGPCKK